MFSLLDRKGGEEQLIMELDPFDGTRQRRASLYIDRGIRAMALHSLDRRHRGKQSSVMADAGFQAAGFLSSSWVFPVGYYVRSENPGRTARHSMPGSSLRRFATKQELQCIEVGWS